jgi:hypothetical protein
MQVSSAPNESRIRARVVSAAPATDGWGAWAELEVLEHEPLQGPAHISALTGKRIRAFVPPPLVDRLSAGESFDGRVSWRGAPGEGFYQLKKG